MAARSFAEPSSGSAPPSHVYHAEAQVLSGELEHPIQRKIEDYAAVVLEKTRREGHFTESVGETTIEGLISFKRGRTSVSGSQLKNKKDLWGNDHSGWVTLSTSVIEGINVFEVITADRLVAQVSTEHPTGNGHVPKVTFLGTRFENLKVSGYPVQVELELDICGERPQDDSPYLGNDRFLERVQRQYERILGAKGLPDLLEKQYDDRITKINDFKDRSRRQSKGDWAGKFCLTCSLVKHIEPIPIPGVKIFGNIIFIPDFGTVSLGEIEVGIEPAYDGFAAVIPPSPSNYFSLEMVKMHMGCIAAGKASAARARNNGTTSP